RATAFPDECGLVPGVGPVDFQRALDGLLEPLERDVLVVVLHPAPGSTATVTAVDGPIGVEEHRGKGQFSVDLEKTDVHPIQLDHAGAHKPVKEAFQIIIFGTDNLPVDPFAGYSGHTAKDDQERLGSLPGHGESGFQVVVDPEGRGLDVLK